MSEKKLNINVIDDLPLLNLDSDALPDVIVFNSGVKIPLIKPNDIIANITADPKMEYLDSMPYGYRENYLHPGLLHIDLVEPEIKEKLKKLRDWLHKKDNTLYFCITPEIPDSVHNVCSYLGDLFADCKNPETSEYRDITNIPYPLKISTHSEDHYRDWVWSCYWPSDLEKQIDYDSLPHEENLLDFPDYRNRYFPVRPLEKAEDGGVIAFSVAVGIEEGKVIVVPQRLFTKHFPNPDDDVTLYIEDIPTVLWSSKGGDRIKIKLKHKDYNVDFKEVNLYWLIRFIYIYYCTQKENSFQYKLKDKKLYDKELDELKFNENRIAQWYRCLLNTEENKISKNFPDTLNEIIKRCINPREMKDRKIKIHDLVCHQKLLPETGFKNLHLTNLKIIFSNEAWGKLQDIEIKGSHPVINDLKGRESGLLKMIMSVTSCEEILKSN